MKHFILATAGHVDHGKSSLVKALTGTDPDRLPEEKARGITIDLGFAHLDLSDPAHPGETLRLGIVDVPGHEDFVKNMVAGVGSVNLALLVVAADDCWMPQTEEHLQILSYLGVSRAVVALTKIDLAARPESQIISDVQARLAGSPLEKAAIVPTSIPTGRGINELKNALAKALRHVEPPPDLGKPRLAVDRVFTLRGIGTVVTGTLTGGKLERGEPVVVQPSGRPTRIRTIQSHNNEVESASPGSRTALNLPDLAIGGTGQDGIQRGDVITLSGLATPTAILDVVLEKSSRLAGSEKGGARPLKHGSLVRWHQGSANFAARVHFRSEEKLLPGESAFAQLRFDSPVFVLSGERFIIRDWPEQFTLGGGIVLDAEAQRERLHDKAQEIFLEARLKHLNDPIASVDALLSRDKAVQIRSMLRSSLFSEPQITEALRVLQTNRKAVLSGEYALETNGLKALQTRAMKLIDEEHRAHPEKSGMLITDLRFAFPELVPWPGLFDNMLASLIGFERTGTHIRRGSHRQELPPHLAAHGERIRSVLLAKPLDPPNRKELAPDTVSQQALRFLLETKQAIELGQEVVLSLAAYSQAVAAVRSTLAKGPATVSDLRQAIGASRRIVVPLLERLDKEGVTARTGDLRRLRAS